MTIPDRCEFLSFGICWVATGSAELNSLFGFGEFIGGLALLAIVYTFSDIRYRFRVQSAPIPLYRLTFGLIGFIGVATLLTDVWLRNHWMVPSSGLTYATWQALLGGLLLALIMTWIWYAFIHPPIYGRTNYEHYASALYRVLLRGSDLELPVIADEISRSASALLQATLPRKPRKNNKKLGEVEVNPEEGLSKRERKFRGYAHDILLMIGDRKLCRHVVRTSPHTAIEFFKQAVALRQFDAPIAQFARNVSTEAILNTDSILYQEDQGYDSGFFGYAKPFSKAIYGNYQFVEHNADGHGSPLDVDYRVSGTKWTGQQMEVYCRCVLITFEEFLKQKQWHSHSFALYRAIHKIRDSCIDVYLLEKVENPYDAEAYKRLEAAVKFIGKLVELIDNIESVPKPLKRSSFEKGPEDWYDHIADIAFDLIAAVARLEAPKDAFWIWAIHHNLVFDTFLSDFGKRDTKAWKIFHRKLKRKIWDEIKTINDWPNYQNVPVLGFCLHVMGVLPRSKSSSDRGIRDLKRAASGFARRHYLKIRQTSSHVADTALVGCLTFDEQKKQIVWWAATGGPPAERAHNALQLMDAPLLPQSGSPLAGVPG